MECASSVAHGLTASGQILYVGGWLLKSRQLEGIGTLTEMAAELAVESCEAYKSGRWYAGASLIRQLIEAEYLMFLFARNLTVAEEWLMASPDKIRKEFGPNRMRSRAGGAFRNKEYWIHCDSGGHPSPAGRHLLANHSDPIGSKEIHWLDLAQHLSRLWSHFCQTLLSIKAHDIVPATLVHGVNETVAKWRAGDIHREIEVPEV